MKWIVCLGILFLSCKTETHKSTETSADTAVKQDTSSITKPVRQDSAKEFGNARFRKVTVGKISETQYRVRGEGQIFEASFNWVIEDGHNELKNGQQMTDAGAPEWGKFDFTIDAPETMNTSLTLILYETSAKDGSRQYELVIPLG
jgi:hypothetical protein